MRHVRRHDDQVALGERELLTPDGHAGGALEHGHDRVVRRGVFGEALPLVEREERDRPRGLEDEHPRDDCAGLVVDEPAKR